MQVYIGAALLIIVIIMSILLICGLPLGEFSMGGRFGKKWPPKIRLIGLSQLLSQIFALYIILSSGAILPYFINKDVTRVICYVFAGFFFFNTVLNAISPSKKEKFVRRRRKRNAKRRIMGHTDHHVPFFPDLAHRGKRKLQTNELSLVDIFIFFRIRFRRPTAATAKQILSDAQNVVLYGVDPLRKHSSDL